MNTIDIFWPDLGTMEQSTWKYIESDLGAFLISWKWTRNEPEVNPEVNLEVTKNYIVSDISCQNANQLTHIKQVIFKGFWLSTEIFFFQN